MLQNVVTFGDQYVNKNAFHINKKLISIDKIEIKRMVLSSKESYGNKGAFEYFFWIYT